MSRTQATVMFFYDDTQIDALEQYEQLRNILEDKATCLKINIVRSPALASTFKVAETPVLLGIENGVEFWRHSGRFSEETMQTVSDLCV